MDFSFLNVYRESFINGFLMTLAVSITALFFSLLIGIVIAMLRFSRVKLLMVRSGLCGIFPHIL